MLEEKSKRNGSEGRVGSCTSAALEPLFLERKVYLNRLLGGEGTSDLANPLLLIYYLLRTLELIENSEPINAHFRPR